MQVLPRWKGDYNTTQHTTGGQVGPSDGWALGVTTAVAAATAAGHYYYYYCIRKKKAE